MNDSERVQALLDLYKQQMGQFQHTQDIEWKANFGIWTLLAVSIYVATTKSVRIHRGCLAFVALLIVVVVHTVWLLFVHSSELADKQLWSRYRLEALAIVRNAHTEHKHEGLFCRSVMREFSWLSVEMMITTLLCLFLYLSLPM
jgi:hypothetical protein